MGCGCNKNGGMRGVGKRPIVTPRRASLQAAGRTPRQVSQLSAQSTNEGMTADRRAKEKARREAILKKLGRL